MILEQLKQTPHPARQILKQYGINNAVLARYLNLTTNYVCSILTGYQEPKKHIDQKIWKLIKELEKEKTAAEASA